MNFRRFMSRHFGDAFAQPPRLTDRRRRTFQLESLEPRTMMAADLRAFDGTGNNVAHPTWGAADTQLLRMAPAAYADGVSSPAGQNAPSARLISNLVVAQSSDIINNREMSAFVYAWGQFLDHDIDQTVDATPPVPLSIPIPTGDPYFDPNGTGTQTMTLDRSNSDPATGSSRGNPLQQLNSITALIDGSQVYGSDGVHAADLRTFEGGHLKTSAGNLLPFNTMGLANDNPLHAYPTTLFAAEDTRANENVELTAMQTLFVREHNRLADRFALQHADWSDEQVYQAARRIVIAELQAITYNEFLPALLGPQAMPAYRGYNPQVNPGIANEFSTAAFRLGHSLVGGDVEFLDNNGNEVHEATPLRDDFFNPQLVEEAGIDPILKYLASDRAQEIDTHVVDDLRNFLFGQPGQGGLDLAALNIERGRDHGLASYNATRVGYGLLPARTFADITKNVDTQHALRAAYGSVDKIDLWVGGLAEDHVAGGSVGALFSRILIDQFQRLRDGDRFWYQDNLSGRELAQVQNTSLADIIRLNTQTTNLQDNVFFFHATITGRVTMNAPSPNGMPTSQPLAGIVVQLQDAGGNVVASTKTAQDGSYSFNQLDLGTYRVQILLPNGQQPTVLAKVIELTRGLNQPARLDFAIGLKPPQGPPTSPPPQSPPHWAPNLADMSDPMARLNRLPR